MDTDTLIALVFSLLPQNPHIPTQDDIIEALVQSNGKPDEAARLLQSNSMAGPSKKRKRIDLEAWLKPPSKKKADVKGKVLQKHPDLSTLKFEKKKPLSSSSSKAPTDLMSILRQPPSPQKGPPRLAPMALSTPELVAENTPCTLHSSVLPSELACRLFYTMMDASQNWKRNKWWLFDRVVESPHLTSFFARRTDGLDDDESWQEAAQYWCDCYSCPPYRGTNILTYRVVCRYNGRMTDPPTQFPPEMEEACRIVEKIVNEEIKKRTRFKQEWGGGTKGDALWRANVAASNCYQGSKESVGFHSDQLTYLGPYPTIASLSLG